MTEHNRHSIGWNFDAEEKVFTVIPADTNPQSFLPAGAYELGFGMAGPFASHVQLKDEELIEFESGPSVKIMAEIRKFWNIRDRYERLGVPYRRGILMHGEPGTGKSGIVRIICDQIINEKGLVVLCKSAGNFTNWLPTLNRMEPDRKVVVVLEDVDEIYDRDEQEFLQMLDGIGNDRPGLLFLATTNFLEDIPERIYRPSRFDLLIEVGHPSPEVRSEYVRSLCERFGTEFRSDIVEASNGLSFAHLKEMLIAVLLYDSDVQETAKRLREHGNIADDEDD